MSEYVSVYLDHGGHRYRVAFHVGLEKVVIVVRQGKPRVYSGKPSETALNIDGPTGKAVVELARPKFKALVGATGGKR